MMPRIARVGWGMGVGCGTFTTRCRKLRVFGDIPSGLRGRGGGAVWGNTRRLRVSKTIGKGSLKWQKNFCVCKSERGEKNQRVFVDRSSYKYDEIRPIYRRRCKA